MTQNRDHIFISYAIEQSALCDWLARKLAAEGYAVWYDRLKLLGGEDWPKDIGTAIKERSFRVLALLSRDSAGKPNPTGEWITALAVGRELVIDDFLIPLNTDGLSSLEIPWNLQTINYIPFHSSWAEGLEQLLKKLESINAPRNVPGGRRLAIQSTSADVIIKQGPEPLMSNCFRIKQLPRFIQVYRPAIDLFQNERRSLHKDWACRDVSASKVLAFHDHPTSRYKLECEEKIEWASRKSIENIGTRDLLANLIHKCLGQVMISKGMRHSGRRRQWYIPDGLAPNNRVRYRTISGRHRWFLGVGNRTFPTKDGGELYRYHISPSFAVQRDGSMPDTLILRIRIYFTDSRGTPLDEGKIQSRRKHLGKAWFNDEWSARVLGVMQLLADDGGLIRFGPEGEQQLVIDAMPLVNFVDIGINDDRVKDADEHLMALIETHNTESKNGAENDS